MNDTNTQLANVRVSKNNMPNIYPDSSTGAFLEHLAEALVSSTPQQDNRPKNTLLNLPYDVFLCVIDHLALQDMFILSRTCRSMRAITLCDWESELENLSRTDEMDFWTGIGYIMPKTWVCFSCCKLHPVDPSDSPRSRKSVCGFDPMITSALSDRGAPSYCGLFHRHVQLALKYSRSGTNLQYLQKLMLPENQGLYRPYGCYTTEPKIVGNRFLSRERSIFRRRQQQIPFTPEFVTVSFRLCPHQVLRTRSQDEVPRDTFFHPSLEFEDKLDLAFKFLGREIEGHCPHCLTDYSVLVSGCRRTITFYAWRDFGSYGSPDNIVWQSQMRSEGQNTERTPMMVWNRVPGIVRQLYGDGSPSAPVPNIH